MNTNEITDHSLLSIYIILLSIWVWLKCWDTSMDAVASHGIQVGSTVIPEEVALHHHFSHSHVTRDCIPMISFPVKLCPTHFLWASLSEFIHRFLYGAVTLDDAWATVIPWTLSGHVMHDRLWAPQPVMHNMATVGIHGITVLPTCTHGHSISVYGHSIHRITAFPKCSSSVYTMAIEWYCGHGVLCVLQL